MSTIDIFNFDEEIKEFINETNKAELDLIAETLKRGDFESVLSQTNAFREKYEINNRLWRILSLIDATCHTQIGENKQAADIIMKMYEGAVEDIDDLILYGNLAFMCDYKLARRIMSDAVKQIENIESFPKDKAAQAYLVLGEAEENLQKFVRAIRYYKRALTYMKEAKEQDSQMITFLYFKLGALHSSINETDEAIDYLQKTIKLAGDDNKELKINSLVSMAKLYGRKDAYEKALPYLNEVIPMFEGSSLANKLVHAEALTDMAYNYFAQSEYDKAVPYYEKAISIRLKLPNYSAREIGMVYMQYAYCLEYKVSSDKLLAGRKYESAFEQLEKTDDHELLVSALSDIIAFFDRTNNKRKKRFYENKFVELTNEQTQTHTH